MTRGPLLVATDLDGTLLRSDRTVSARTAAALRDAEAGGTDVVFVTARPPRWVDEVAHAVGGHGVVLCLNGALVYDAVRGVALATYPMADALVAALVADLRAAAPGVVLAFEAADGSVMETGYVRVHPERVPSPRVARIETALAGTTGKLLARCQAMADDVFLALVRGVVGERATLSDSGEPGLAEITGPGVTKAAVLERWCAGRGIAAEDVWAFGDMPGDLPMLAWAGTSFAVANAHPAVLAAADHVCGSNDEDGVAVVLEGLLTGRTSLGSPG